MRVAYQGEPGAFSEAAVLRLLPEAEPRPCPTFDDVFDAVSTGTVNLGVVPIENSIGGSIHRNYDLLVERELSIVGEVQVPVAHNLLALPGVGPYAAAHVMLTSLGRYSRLVLDSWTRPTYYKLSGARSALKDATIERRFKRYGDWAGLAFWLYLTRGWVEEGLPV